MITPDTYDGDGEHLVVFCAPTSVDRVGFTARRSGFEVRDCLSIQTPEGPLCSLLLRRPFEDTIVGQVVRKSRGTLLIGASRLSVSDADPNLRPNWESHTRSTGSIWENADGANKDFGTQGRFPSNFLLVHGPACECVGTKKVKKGGGNGEASQTRAYSGEETIQFTGSEGKRVSHYDEDGKEEVADWRCQVDCPVSLLDQQSGILKSGLMKAGQQRQQSKGLGGYQDGFPDEATSTDTFGDEGGASRFFYQATSLTDLKSYLSTLTQNEPEDYRNE